jgi:hypothetical protein
MIDRETHLKLENIVMIILWFAIFCGGVCIIPISIGIINVNIAAIFGLLLGIFYICISLYYLNKRIRSVLK